MPDRRLLAIFLLVATAGLLGLSSCAAPPRPEPVTAQPEPKPEPEAPAEPAEKPAEEPPPDRDRDTLVVVDPGGGESRSRAGQSLAEASRAEKERRAKSGPSSRVITDKNLSKLASGGQVTFIDPKSGPKKAGGEGADGEGEAATDQAQHDEAYWRQRAIEIRTRWGQLAGEVKELEKSAAGWRRRFYDEADPYVRDGQIKPEWDRTLDRLGQARIEAEAAQKELADFLEEGRRAGALPGWLRAGKEKEPRIEPPPPRPGEPIEPPVIEPPVIEPPTPPAARKEDGA